MFPFTLALLLFKRSLAVRHAHIKGRVWFPAFPFLEGGRRKSFRLDARARKIPCMARVLKHSKWLSSGGSTVLRVPCSASPTVRAGTLPGKCERLWNSIKLLSSHLYNHASIWNKLYMKTMRINLAIPFPQSVFSFVDDCVFQFCVHVCTVSGRILAN